MPASTISSVTWMPRGRSSSAAALVIARTPNAPAAHRPRPGIARRAEPPVTCTSVDGRPCAIANRPLADKNENAARAGAAAHESKPSGAASAVGPPPKGPARSPPLDQIARPEHNRAPLLSLHLAHGTARLRLGSRNVSRPCDRLEFDESRPN